MSSFLKVFLYIVVFFSSSVFAETLITFNPDTGEQYYSTVQQAPAGSVTQKTSGSASPAALNCTGTITNNISMTTLPPTTTIFYNFTQSTRCNNKIVTMSLTNYSSANIKLGLQRYLSGTWTSYLSPSSTLYQSLALPTGTYRWTVANLSTGTNGLYTGYYTVKF